MAMSDMKIVRKHRQPRDHKPNKKGLKKSVKIVLVVLLVVVVAVVGFCLIAGMFSNSDSYAIENDKTSTLIMNAGDKMVLSVSADADVMEQLEFESTNPDVLTVDSGGRVDAIKEGKTTIIAQSDDYYGSCVITVNKAQPKKAVSEYTSAYVDNLDIVEKNKADKSKNLYKAVVNRKTNTVTIYTYDSNGKYTVPVRAMICSCGLKNSENITPTGTFSVYFKEKWQPLYGGVYGMYVTGFYGDYLFHSVPYRKTSADSLKTDEFNKLGDYASQGCVRLQVSDAKWVYDNLSMNTVVQVIDKDAKSDPLGRPSAIKANSKIKWDPSDPDKKNPYNKLAPEISGAKDVTIKKGQAYKPQVTAKDTCSNNITKKIVVTGNVITNKVGTYKVTYAVTDDLGKTAEKTVTITVAED